MQSEVYCVLAVSDFSLWVCGCGECPMSVCAGVLEIIARERGQSTLMFAFNGLWPAFVCRAAWSYVST